MSEHSTSVFNNSCLKLPRNPRSDHPLPVYEQKYINQLRNQARRRLSLGSSSTDMKPAAATKTKSSNKSSTKNNSVRSFIEFYDSIPEYDDVNHLSNREFYRKIEMLKEKQKSYFDHVQKDNKYERQLQHQWMDEYKSFVGKEEELLELEEQEKKKHQHQIIKPTIKPFCATPILNKSPKFGSKHINDDVESLTFSDKDQLLKPPSRRSVRIETPSEEKLSSENTPTDLFRIRPKSRSASSKGHHRADVAWDDFSINDFNLDASPSSPVHSKSAPNSPGRGKPSVGWKDGITIPRPFEMTVRDEENQIVEEILTKTSKPQPEEKPEMFKAHPIPIESQIPLFDKIMADQELKNHIVRERRKAMLQSQMRPFSFTKRDEEIQELTKRLSRSTPSLFLEDPPIRVRKFRAKPIPKNLFSNYVYKKMHEDEFYRALQKRIRAEEMLRAASLPPSMAKREKTTPKYDVCPKSYRDAEAAVMNLRMEPKNSKKSLSYYKFAQDKFEKELEDLKNEFLASYSPKGGKTKGKRGRKGKKKSYRDTSATSSSDSRTISSLELSRSVSRSNLAAVLRIESARKRLEDEMSRKLEEAKLKEESRWKEKLMRKKPVWQTLAYSHEEDLAMRLQLRRDEEKLRNEEHRLRMQLMLGRVNQQPTLFERQSQIQHPKTKAELMDSLYLNYKQTKRSLSDMTEVKKKRDEAVQAILDDDASSTKENSQEEIKEKCDTPSSDNEDSN